MASYSDRSPGISLNPILIRIPGFADWVALLSPQCLGVGSSHQQVYFYI